MPNATKAAATPFLLAAAMLLGASVAGAQQPPSLMELSLEELLDIEITSVSRKEQTVGQTAAAAYVISSEDISRSGATTLPDVLRLVPGFSVARLNANTWSVAARGFGGTHANKLLVMIDGRSIYTPLYGGVNWEMQLLPLDAIAQIEVVRGPGGSLWGANAINGVINIITKPAHEASGGRMATRIGESEPGAFDARYGDRLGTSGHYVAEARYFRRNSHGLTGGLANGDDLEAAYGRTRVDWAGGADEFSFQADLSKGAGEQVTSALQLTPPFRAVSRQTSAFTGGSSMLSWTHARASRVETGVQASYSGFDRSLLEERSHTIDIDARQRRAVGTRHDVVAGLQYRFTASVVAPMATVSITPATMRAHLATAFVEDEITLGERVRFTSGIKIERNQDTGFEVQPSVRALWSPTPTQSIWGAVSRAVRTPNRFERGMYVITAASQGPGPLPVVVTLSGSPDVSPEIVTAYEAGYRAQRGAVSLDVTAFVGAYDDLATHGRGTPAVGLVWNRPVLIVPLTAQNDGTAITLGTELTGTWKPRAWWQLSGSYSWLDVTLGSQSANSGSAATVPINGPVPEHQVHVRTYVNLFRNLRASALFYHVSAIPAIAIAGYERLDLRVTWSAHPRVTLAAGAQNLLHDPAAEYTDLTSPVVTAPVRSSVYGEVIWRF